jgi:hypothetical protein
MKLAEEFPSAFYRGGPAAVTALAQGVESLGYDELDVFDHVTMAQPMDGPGERPGGEGSGMGFTDPATAQSSSRWRCRS